MAPRPAARPARENDFSNVGKVGRRTGIILPQGRVDENGIEEISGIFSSPRKPSPLRKSMTVMQSVEENITPGPRYSTRRSTLPPRSASPRKSGIGGTAKRGRNPNALGRNSDKENQVIERDRPRSATKSTLPTSASVHRFSPEETPPHGVARSRAGTTRTSRRFALSPQREVQQQHRNRSEDADSIIRNQTNEPSERSVDYNPPSPALLETDPSGQSGYLKSDAFEPLPLGSDDDDVPPVGFEPEMTKSPRSREPTVANSRRKRRSDAVEEIEQDVISSPAAKRAKRISDGEQGKDIRQRTREGQQVSTRDPEQDRDPETSGEAPGRPISGTRGRGRPVKDLNNMQLSKQRRTELEKVIDKHRPIPGQGRSLYVLRRETPADDGVTHTRSGRVTFKPLAYWRNEKCVYGGSPGGATVLDGARFPVNSIKEIIRTEAVENNATSSRQKKGSKTKGKGKIRSQPIQPREPDDEELDDQERIDPDAEPWETEIGTFRGNVSVWDPYQQAPIEQDEKVDLAYAPAAMETKEVKDSTFRYAKLLSVKFFGSGIVDLPPGGVKKPKNSRTMHMCFFVATGRVTVHVGPISGPDNVFSLGKGGFWQVPRGNQYSIANEHDKPARIFFSQASEPAPREYGYDE